MRILSLLVFALSCSSSAFAQDLNMTLTSSAFEDQGSIPLQYTCQGSNSNPPLIMKNIPAHTESLVLLVHDPDAPAGDWVHWAVYGINPKMAIIPENSIPGRELINNFNQYHYSGPCPPAGELHHYLFDFYALDTEFAYNENGSPQTLLQRIKGHVLAKTQLTGTFKK
jgi:Raf kinase inhibitor-like YbhB/YbcL family protein